MPTHFCTLQYFDLISTIYLPFVNWPGVKHKSRHWKWTQEKHHIFIRTTQTKSHFECNERCVCVCVICCYGSAAETIIDYFVWPNAFRVGNGNRIHTELYKIICDDGNEFNCKYYECAAPLRVISLRVWFVSVGLRQCWLYLTCVQNHPSPGNWIQSIWLSLINNSTNFFIFYFGALSKSRMVSVHNVT